MSYASDVTEEAIEQRARAEKAEARVAELEAAIEKAYVAIERSAGERMSDLERSTFVLEASDHLENVLPRLAVVAETDSVSTDPETKT